MFWFLLIVYLVGLLVFIGLLQAFNENKNSTGLMLSILGLGVALLLFGAHLWYAFYTLMLLPWFTFCQQFQSLIFGAFILLSLYFAAVSRLNRNNFEG